MPQKWSSTNRKVGNLRAYFKNENKFGLKIENKITILFKSEKNYCNKLITSLVVEGKVIKDQNNIAKAQQ